MTLFRGSDSAGQGYGVEFLRSDRDLSDVDSPSNSRSNLGLGSLATQSSSSANITGGTITGITSLESSSATITGGSITGITNLAVADGGTGASSASSARTNLGLGSAAVANLLDEDNFSSNSATDVPSQQSTKAYADTKLASPGTSSNVSLAFDTWRTPNASRPVFVSVEVQARTDGATNGIVSFEVDESGGTSADYNFRVAFAEDATSSGAADIYSSGSFMIPAGAAYRIVNEADPSGANTIQNHREFVL